MTMLEGVKNRHCAACNSVMPANNFYCTTLKKTGRVQYQSACKSCYKVRIKKYETKRRELNNGVSRSVLARVKNLRSYAAHIINMAKARARKKNMEFSIDVDWLLSALEQQNLECAISGVRMAISAGTGKRLFNGVSIDRIDNASGYTAENCWLVCYSINAFKGDADLQQVISLCKSVSEKWDC